MDRRNFLRSMLGVAAATALPSEVWPFKKIFLPLVPRITRIDMLDLSHWGQIHATEPYEMILHPEQAKLLSEIGMYHVTNLNDLPSARSATYLGLSRASYPGRLSA